jgi:scyllo-inositol 2-dehydrogenase (NADP+)
LTEQDAPQDQAKKEKMTIHVGLVGYGMASSVFHAPLIASTAGLELSAVVSSQPEKVQRDFPTISVVPTLDRLLARPEITLVVIATPNETHYDLAKQALAAGKHVVVDKPFTLHTEQADELIALAHKQQVVLSVFHNRRWDNDFLTIRHLLQTGLLGEVVTYEAHYDRYRPTIRDRWRERAQPGAGTLYDLGSHLIDQALFLFGLPQAVWADVQAQRTGAQTDDYFHLVLSYPRQRVILHSASLVRQPGPRFQIHGQVGSFIKYGLDSQEDALKAGKRPGDPGWGEDRTEDYGTLTTDMGEITVEGKIKTLPGRYEAFYQEIVAALTLGKPVPVSAEEARNTVKLIEAALQSHKEQRTIRLL